jgi:hypothetical protein
MNGDVKFVSPDEITRVFDWKNWATEMAHEHKRQAMYQLLK